MDKRDTELLRNSGWEVNGAMGSGGCTDPGYHLRCYRSNDLIKIEEKDDAWEYLLCHSGLIIRREGGFPSRKSAVLAALAMDEHALAGNPS